MKTITNKRSNQSNSINNNNKQEKILLGLLPFWDPLNPPLGISCIKSFLQKHGYHVRAEDLNTKEEFKEIYERYFNTLKDPIPLFNRSNFYNIGKEVLVNHLMAHLHYTDEREYIELLKILVYQTFYTDIGEEVLFALMSIVKEFYSRLEQYFISLLEREKPTVLGLSVLKGSLPASLFSFKLAKTLYPYIKTVMGGGIFDDQLAVGSPDLELLLKKAPYIDTLIIGEGELLFLKYLRGQLPKKQRVYSLKDINNEVLDLSTVVVPDFSDLNLQGYAEMGAYGSRSCPFHCKFCSETVRWGKFRKKSARQIVEELSTLYQRYGNQLFLLSDSLLNPIAVELAEEFSKSDFSIYWDGYLRVDKLVLFKRAGKLRRMV